MFLHKFFNLISCGVISHFHIFIVNATQWKIGTPYKLIKYESNRSLVPWSAL